MKNISQLMKQAQTMQNNLQKAQAEIRQMIVEGAASGGLVKITLGGDRIVKRVEMDAGLIRESAEDKGMLEDMVMVAINDALKKLDEAEKTRMSAVTAGMPLPPGMGF